MTVPVAKTAARTISAAMSTGRRSRRTSRERRAAGMVAGALPGGHGVEIVGARCVRGVDPPADARSGAVAHGEGGRGGTTGQDVDVHRLRQAGELFSELMAPR